MSILKKGIAFLMSAMLILPTIPVSAAQADDSGKAAQKGETLSYNLGSAEVELLSPDHKKITWDKLTDGKDVYVIEAEDDAFFPYEVQFTYNGKKTKEWFLSQDDTVEIGDYRFGIHSDVTGTELTELTLNVGGQEVTVYPEGKEFTSGNRQLRSLLRLKGKNLRVDLTDITPIELGNVSLKSVVFGNETLDPERAKVSFKRKSSDEDFSYVDLEKDERTNLNDWGGSTEWEMIVGTVDQLDKSNIRYFVTINTSYSYRWLKAAAYTQNSDGVRAAVDYVDSRYDDYAKSDYDTLYIEIPPSRYDSEDMYVSLQVAEQYANKKIKAYEGTCVTEEEVLSAQDITDKIFCTDMLQKDAGYLMEKDAYRKDITLAILDDQDEILGIRPIQLHKSILLPSHSSLTDEEGNYVSHSWRGSYSYKDNVYTIEHKLEDGYPKDATYYFYFGFTVNGRTDNSKVTAAYVGTYSSIAQAVTEGATDIKEQLFDSATKYGANLSNGVEFTIFVGEDGSANQEVYHECIKLSEETSGSSGSNVQRDLYSGTAVTFKGLRDVNGNYVESYCVDSDNDSYGTYNFHTIIVRDNTVDLSSLAPIFDTSTGVNLYAEGGNAPEKSGQSVHDFSNGIVQYTASAENGTDSANYWLQVVKWSEGPGQLYMNSLIDEASDTRIEDGVIYSTREMFIDSLHDNRHDILLANIGTEAIANLGVELTSDTVELDRYWTLYGNHELSGLNYFAFEEVLYDDYVSTGELDNLAKLRLKLKEGVEAGSDITGTLTIKSGSTPLMVINLIGTAGNPSIITKEVPQAVKYVPYGTMIQNSNKYSWNKTSYELVSGTLPAGMELKENGELYGVPKEMGTFTFKVKMKNSYSGFSDSEKELSLTILDNTDSNVEAATDEGYKVSTRIADVSENDTAESYLFVSEGSFDQFTDIYIDGDKLTKDIDYSAESGSTRITIKSETMKKLNNGTHTIGVEFRTEAKEVKRAAQNVKVQKSSSSNNNSGSNTSNNSNNSSSNSSSNNSGNNSTSDGNTGKDTTKKPEESKEPVTTEPEEPETNPDIEKAVNAKKRVVTKKTVNKTKKTMVSWLDKSGKTIKNSFVITPKGNLVYVDKKGVMKQGTGFAFNGKRYYASKSGVIVKNGFFETERGNTVYATKSGELKAKTVFKIKGKQYVAKKSGALAKNRWYTIGKKKYYCDKNGIVKKVKEL